MRWRERLLVWLGRSSIGFRKATIVLVMAFALGACGGTHPTNRPKLTQSSPAAAPSTSSPSGYRFPAKGIVRPGGYMTRTNPAVLLRLGRGWRYQTTVSESLHRVASFVRVTNGEDALQFIDPEGVYEPTNRTNPPLGAVPADLAGWLRRNKWLDLSRPIRVRVGGLPAEELEGGPRPFRSSSPACAAPCVPLFGPPAVTAAGYTFYPGDKAVFEILRVHTLPLVIWIVGPRARYKQFLHVARQAVASVRFR
jgi:hypothetical protein